MKAESSDGGVCFQKYKADLSTNKICDENLIRIGPCSDKLDISLTQVIKDLQVEKLNACERRSLTFVHHIPNRLREKEYAVER